MRGECNSSSDGLKERATADGFDVVGTRLTSDCAPIVLMREEEHVASDGTVTVVRSNVASVSDACI
jgi:hypothetical protein